MKRLLPVLQLVAALMISSLPVWAEDPETVIIEEEIHEVHLKDKPKPAGVEMKVEECFKIHWLLRADETHYWADWVSECPYTVDAVYVMIGFLDHGKNHLGNGVWPMYFVLPGAHQVTRFSAPAEVLGFEAVIVHKVTTQSAEAFSQDRNTVQTVRSASATPGSLKDTGASRVIPATPTIPAR
jgi:hypothetical protein